MTNKGPSKAIESIVARLIPPARREEVLGDLRERYRGTAQYLIDALRTVPHVTASQIVRTIDPRLVVAEAFSFYFGFFLSSRNWQGPAHDQAALASAIPSGVALISFLFLHAYVPQGHRTEFRLASCAAIAVAIASATELFVRSADPRLALSGRSLVVGSLIAGVMAWQAAAGMGVIYRGKPDR